MSVIDEGTRDHAGEAKLANGWYRLAPDFGRALLSYLGNKGIVLSWVIEQSWATAWWTADGSGPPEPRPVKLNVSALARATGKRANKLREATKLLIKDGLLTRHEDGSLEPNKHYMGWPGLSGDPVLAYVSEGSKAMARARKSAAETTPNGVVLGHPKRTPNGVVSGLKTTPNGVVSQNPATPKGVEKRTPKGVVFGQNPGGSFEENLSRDSPPPTPPAGGMRVSLDGSYPLPPLEATDEPFAPTEAPPLPPARPVTILPPTPGGSTVPLPPMTRRDQATAAFGYGRGDVVPDQKLLDKLLASLALWFPQHNRLEALIRDLSYSRYQYETTWIVKALKRLHCRQIFNPGWPLVLKILEDWRVLGGPNEGPEDRLDDDLKLIPYSQRTPGRPVRWRPGDPLPSNAPPAGRPPTLDEIAAYRKRAGVREKPVTKPAPPAGDTVYDEVIKRLASHGKANPKEDP